MHRIEYSPKGLPIFLSYLDERPKKPGDRFTIVHLTNGQPIKSYDIIVAGDDSDFSKPFKVVYEWTGRGFVGGAQVSMVTTDVASRTHTHNRDESAFMLAFAFAPLVIGTAGGFVVGVVDGIRTTAEELGKVIVGKKEQVVAYTAYEYDTRDRLALTRMYRADDLQHELVRTEFFYHEDDSAPHKTVVTTFPDGVVRIVEYERWTPANLQ